MFLPNADEAIIDVKKITEYVLSFDHFEGKNKARVFASVFGITKLNAEDLIKAIREAILKTEAVKQSESAYGTKYTVDFEFKFNYKTGTIRTAWIVEKNVSIARFITCYLKLQEMGIRELDVVALLRPLPDQHLAKGAIGTVVHVYDQYNYEVEFADLKGQTYALLTLSLQDILLLKHEPEMV
jgi:hypothetical protein